MTHSHYHAAAVLAAALALVTTASADVSGTKPLPQRFTLFSANDHGKNLPMAVEAVGPINGIATETQTEKNIPGGQINYVTLRFTNGSVRLVAPERFGWKPDFRACAATAFGGGTFTIAGGSGAYRGATGKGTFTDDGVLIGARSASGKCLGRKAQPTVNYVTVTLVGKAALSS